LSLMKEAFFCMLFSFFVIGIVLLIGLNLSFFNPFKNAFKDFSYLDLYYSEKFNEDQFNDDIILVNINRLNRKEIALVLDNLQKHDPKVIGLDVIFKEKENTVWDSLLAKTLTDASFVFAYSVSEKEKIVSDSTIQKKNGVTGYTNFNFDKEAIVIRNFQGIKKNKKETLISFPVAVTQHYVKGNWLKRKEPFLEVDRPINYTSTRDNFLVLESRDIIGQEAIPFLKNKIVLVGYLGGEGTYEYDIEDKHYTPMNVRFAGKSPPDTFGLIIHANIIQMLITDNYITIVPHWIIVLLTVILTLIALAYFIYLNKKQLASYILRLNLVQLIFTILIVWLSLILFRNGVLFKITSITAVVVFSIGLIGYYKKLAHYLFKQFKWEGYFYHD
jgi:CHASE2 domain-containing sensor protein